MRASAIFFVTTGFVLSVCAASPTRAMPAGPAGLRTAMPALDPVEPVHCRRYSHAHRHGHPFSRGCGVVRRDRGVVVPGGYFEPTPLQTIQSGTRPLRSGESTRVEPLRRGPDSPTPSGVRPLSSERQSTGSSSSPFSTPSSGSPFGGSGGSSGGLR
jgi:uncharacterized membrane protein YgcG